MSWTTQSKNTTTFTPGTKHTSIFDDGLWYLLQEIGDYLLQENGDKIVLQESWNQKVPTDWTAQTKN